MAWIDHERKFVFFAAPGTGSTAVLQQLRKSKSGRYFPKRDVMRDGKRVARKKHSTAHELRQAELLTPEIEDYFWFVGVRNPFALHVATYLRDRTKRLEQARDPNSWIGRLPEEPKKNLIERAEAASRMTFAEYLRQKCEKKKRPWELHKPYHVGINAYLHQEDLDHDFERVRKQLGLPEGLRMQRANVTGALDSSRSYRDYYDDGLKALVYRYNGPFFERFPEYSFEGYERPAGQRDTL